MPSVPAQVGCPDRLEPTDPRPSAGIRVPNDVAAPHAPAQRTPAFDGLRPPDHPAAFPSPSFRGRAGRGVAASQNPALPQSCTARLRRTPTLRPPRRTSLSLLQGEGREGVAASQKPHFAAILQRQPDFSASPTPAMPPAPAAAFPVSPLHPPDIPPLASSANTAPRGQSGSPPPPPP